MIPPLFNPSNDMSLAMNVAPYIPPMRVQRMEKDLESLARFWDEGPWGWSRGTRYRYTKLGVALDELPADDWLDNVRRLSNRSFACYYIGLLLQEDWGGALVGEHMRFHTSYSPAQGEVCVFKLPWSSSGRGVVFTSNGITPHIELRIKSYLRTQGGYVEDRFYTDKQLDFAMEFMARRDGTVDFLGYSVFHTDKRGEYVGNVVASQATLLELIGVDEKLLQRLAAYHCSHLCSLGYHGPIGIDMMRLADGRIHPVVEINFRRNMGILAMTLYEQGLTHNVDLTPAVRHGYQAVVRNGLLTIYYNK